MSNELLDAARYRKLIQILETGIAAEVMVNIQRLYLGQANSLPHVEIQVHQVRTGLTKIYQGETLNSLLDGVIDQSIHTRETT